MTTRLQTYVEGDTEQPSTSRRKSPTLWSSALDAITMSSVLLVLNLSRFDIIQNFTPLRQLTSDCGGSWVDGLV